MVFLADNYAVRGKNQKVLSQTVNTLFEPFTLLSAISAVTKHIGIVGTVSTTFNEPFNVTRRFASLDHLSGGRRLECCHT